MINYNPESMCTCIHISPNSAFQAFKPRPSPVYISPPTAYSEKMISPPASPYLRSEAETTFSSNLTVTRKPSEDDLIEVAEQVIGKYTKSQRKEKIRVYKERMLRRRNKIRCSKKFSGRAEVASRKIRYHGRFVKASEVAEKGMIPSEQDLLERNTKIDQFLREQDYNNLINVITLF